MSTTSSASSARAMKALTPPVGTQTPVKDQALLNMAQALRQERPGPGRGEPKDLEEAEVVGLEKPLMARLKFPGEDRRRRRRSRRRWPSSPTPWAARSSARELDAGLELFQVSCPLGVVAVIFESPPRRPRPDGRPRAEERKRRHPQGREQAKHSNRILADLLHATGVSSGLAHGLAVPGRDPRRREDPARAHTTAST